MLLAQHLVAWVRADTADLAHRRYDGDPAADLARLAEAESLLRANDPLLADIAHLRQVVTGWLSVRA